jgi:hypothetical protein
MKPILILIVLATVCLSSIGVGADIYVWTDENGIKHFTNRTPPPQAKLLMRTPEIPYDEEADRQRREEEREAELTMAWQEIAEKEAQLVEMQAAAERRLAEAERRANETLQQAEALINQAASYDHYPRRGGYISYGYYPYKYYRHYYDKRRHYRIGNSIYYKKSHSRVRHYDKYKKYGSGIHKGYGGKKYHNLKKRHKSIHSGHFRKSHSNTFRTHGSAHRFRRH